VGFQQVDFTKHINMGSLHLNHNTQGQTTNTDIAELVVTVQGIEHRHTHQANLLLQDCDYLFQFYIVDVQFDLPWHVKNNVFLLVYFDFRNQPINILQQKLESVNKTSIRT
jgi:hypothetical protein